MRQGSPGGRRPRGRHNGGNGGPSGGGMRDNNNGPRQNRSAASLRHQTFDSNGPDVRVRGNAWQVYEKYQSLARDAQSSGDRVLAENYLQYAEHYYRVIEAINEATAAEQRARGIPPFGGQPDVPSNYYTPDGQLTGGQPQPPAPDMGQGQQPAAGDATVTMRNQPPASPDPFLATDEGDDTDSGPQKLVAGR